MAGAIESIGEAVSGAAWARAAEPTRGEARHAGHGVCLNCATPLTGRYCHECGQSGHVHRTLMSIVHDLLHGVFHFEGKIWHTVPMLVLHPGQLTRRYIAGERARFVSPLALFLFTVFLMFAVYSAVASESVMSGIAEGWNSVPAAPLQQGQAKARAALAEAVADRARLAAAHQPTATADKRIAELRDDVASLDEIHHQIDGPVSGSKLTVNSRWHWLNQGLQRARSNPGLVVYKVQSAAYKYSWALIFLSTPFVWLTLFWRRRFGMYDHATFVTYSISFMSMLIVVVTLLAAVGAPKPLTIGLLLLAPPAHLFAQLRGAYALGVWGALWRTAFLLFVALNALMLFAVGVVALEVAG